VNEQSEAQAERTEALAGQEELLKDRIDNGFAKQFTPKFVPSVARTAFGKTPRL